ncbi:MAG: fimbrial protein [Bacteriovoracaceae bacterium]
MKKSLFALLITTSFSALAGPTGSLLVKGVVPQILDVLVSGESIASNLPLNTTQTNTKIATIQEKSNSASGYKITISSANSGKLVRNGGSQIFNYTMSYNGQPLTLTSPVVLNNPGAAAVTTSKNLNISYSGVPHDQLVAGDYLDTITFAIAAI